MTIEHGGLHAIKPAGADASKARIDCRFRAQVATTRPPRISAIHAIGRSNVRRTSTESCISPMREAAYNCDVRTKPKAAMHHGSCPTTSNGRNCPTLTARPQRAASRPGTVAAADGGRLLLVDPEAGQAAIHDDTDRRW